MAAALDNNLRDVLAVANVDAFQGWRCRAKDIRYVSDPCIPMSRVGRHALGDSPPAGHVDEKVSDEWDDGADVHGHLHGVGRGACASSSTLDASSTNGAKGTSAISGRHSGCAFELARDQNPRSPKHATS